MDQHKIINFQLMEIINIENLDILTLQEDIEQQDLL